MRLLAALGVAFLAAAFPLRHAAQTEEARKAASPNGKIVFQSTQGGDGFVNDIYVMDADGKRQTRLTDDPNDDVSPVWSPQGDKIAFLSNRRGNGHEIFLMNADGGDQRPLREETSVNADFDWSPDGTRLAYASGGAIHVIEVAGENAPYSVSDGKAFGSNDLDARWSPDGLRLVIRNDSPGAACLSGCTDLYTVKADGSNRAPLVVAPGFDVHPRWSADGSLVAYVGDRGGEWGLYVIPSDGSGAPRKVSAADVSLGAPAWSPAGARLAFKSSLGDVHVVNADGSGLLTLSQTPSTSGGVFWSPDGSKVGFHDTNAVGCVDILVVAADGSARHVPNYTKTRSADEFAFSWQKLATQ